jgi:hypothetical protein
VERPIENYWRIRLAGVAAALEKNNFAAAAVSSLAAAKRLVLEELLPRLAPKSISWGGSMTFTATGLYDALKEWTGGRVIDTFDAAASDDEKLQRRREALLADLFITGTNALTQDGTLVNLDMIGNRVGALTFGPKAVIVLAGRNKIVPDLNAAMHRIKTVAAPANAMRLDKRTPCVKTATCHACDSPDRICNTWTITEKSFPKGRIQVVLINEPLGL